MTVNPIRLPQPPARASPELPSGRQTEVIQLGPQTATLPPILTTPTTSAEGARK